MTRNVTWGAACLALLAASPLFAVDPQRTRQQTQQQQIQQPFSPATNLAIPGSIAPGSTFNPSSIPGGLNIDDRARFSLPGQPGQQIFVPNPQSFDPTNPTGIGATYQNPGYNPQIVPPGTPTQPQPAQQARWRLGVYSKDTDTGVRVMQIVQGGAAQRAGLEANDVIVSVNGYQVGYVNGSLFDCSGEFERLANKDGWVVMLVLDNRDRTLKNVPVQLDSRYQKITGAITYNDQTQLPANAVLTVELKEIIRPNAPMVTLATNKFTQIKQYPIPYDIEFDPMQIDGRRTYVVTATITSANQTLYAIQQPRQVLTPTTPKQVALALDRIGPNIGSPYAANDQQLEQIVQWYRDYLKRDPTAQELMVWRSQVQNGTASQLEAQSFVLAHPAFFTQCDRDKQQYVERLHEVIIGRTPTADELDYWAKRYDARQGIRQELAREFLASVGEQR